MLPSKPLSELIPQILSHIQQNYANQIVYNRKLLDIHNGNLLKYVEESMALELSARSLQRSKGRIPAINILSQVVTKLSRVYTEPASRDASENEIDKQLLSYYERELDVDNQLSTANELLNLHKYFAIEPYLDHDGVPDMRILPADKFLVWSDNANDPTAMTVFIKFMGSIQKMSTPLTDQNGKVLKNAENAIRDVALYHLYSDNEFIIVDAEGVITDQRLNPYKKIPFVYCSNSAFELIPTPDSDNLSMAVLIPKLLTDINYATQFQSHSIVYGIDIDPSNLDASPDAFWCINSVAGDNKTPSIGTIKPEVDTEKVISLINAEMSMWLESKGLKTSSNGGASVETATSGVSKLIDQADASASNRKQVQLFRRFEGELWKLISVMHSFWVSTQQMKDQTKDFSIKFNPVVKFAESKVIVDTKSVLEELKIMFELGITTPEQALMKLYPELKPDQIKQLLSEIDTFKGESNDSQLNKISSILDSQNNEEPNQ